MVADVIIAEPGALVGFAGPRVIEQITKQKLPEGFQTAEFLLDHGMIDGIVARPDLTAELSRVLAHYSRIRPADPLLMTADEPGQTVETPVPVVDLSALNANGEVRK
jgi:acetyl-CoA carboxylase carboxyl transferase subunit beta